MWIALHKHVRVMGLDNGKLIFNLQSDKILLMGIALAATLLVAGWFIISAKNVTLIVDGEPFHMVVHGSTVGEVLEEAGIEVNPGDAVRPALNSEVYDKSVIVVGRKQKVEIFDGTEKKTAFMTMRSVPEILSAHGFTLGKDDEVEANLNPEKGELPSIQITRRNVFLIKERRKLRIPSSVNLMIVFYLSKPKLSARVKGES